MRLRMGVARRMMRRPPPTGHSVLVDGARVNFGAAGPSGRICGIAMVIRCKKATIGASGTSPTQLRRRRVTLVFMSGRHPDRARLSKEPP